MVPGEEARPRNLCLSRRSLLPIHYRCTIGQRSGTTGYVDSFNVLLWIDRHHRSSNRKSPYDEICTPSSHPQVSNNWHRDINHYLTLQHTEPHAAHHRCLLVLQCGLHAPHNVVSPFLEILAEVQRLAGVFVKIVEVGPVSQQLLHYLESG